MKGFGIFFRNRQVEKSAKTIILGILLSLFSTPLFSQVWTLAACLEYAEKNNYQIQKSANTVDIADANLDQASGAQLPTLNGSASNNYNFGRNIDPFTNQFTTSRVRSNNFSVSSSLNLFSGLQLRYSIKQSQYDKAASVKDVEELKRQLSLNVASAFLDVRLQQQLWRQAKDRAQLSENAYLQSQKLVIGGIVPESNLTELFAQWKSDELDAVTFSSQVETSVLILKSTMNFPLQDPFSVDSSDVNFTTKLFSLDSCLSAALGNHPGLESGQLRVESSHWAYKSAYARYFPRLNLNASLSTLYSSSSKQLTGYSLTGYQFIGITQTGMDTVLAPNLSPEYENKSFNNQFKDNFNRFIGLTLTVPMLNGFQVRKSVERAKIQVRNSELDIKIKETTIRQDVVRAYSEYRNADIQLQAASVSKQASQQALEQAEKRYAAGLGTAYEITQARQRLAVSESEETRSRYTLAFRTKVLEFYMNGKMN